jgi:hypothetical protein
MRAKMKHNLRRAIFAACVLAPLAALAQTAPTTPAAGEQPPAAAPPAVGEAFQVDGFRSAHWGMTDAQVKAAIRQDFNIPPEKVKSEENAAERTTVLLVTVPDVLEGAGLARVSYILGYTSKKLIQVSILWGTAVDPQAPPDKIVTAANQLRELLLNSGYQSNTIIVNARLPDGTILVFQGQDADKHSTVLRLASTPAQTRGGKEEKPSTALSLSYIVDSQNPDIYRLKKGQF